jgi:sialate O-acetylesterase
MTFRAVLWDQGEADAKRTNSSWYAQEFPHMILGWRDAFEVPDMPFFYVELCTEYDAEEPKEDDFWLAQRAATELPQVGFAVTTDIQRALHPPDKQDVADRLALEVRRIVYGEKVVSRGPELLSAEADGKTVVLTFSDASLTTHAGIFVGDSDACDKDAGSVVTDPLSNRTTLNYTISGAKMTVSCESPSGLVRVNADYATCFLYGSAGLPAPPIQQPCSPTESVYIV